MTPVRDVSIQLPQNLDISADYTVQQSNTASVHMMRCLEHFSLDTDLCCSEMNSEGPILSNVHRKWFRKKLHKICAEFVKSVHRLCNHVHTLWFLEHTSDIPKYNNLIQGHCEFVTSHLPCKPMTVTDKHIAASPQCMCTCTCTLCPKKNCGPELWR